MRRQSRVDPAQIPKSREELEVQFPGQVWDTREVAATFIITAILNREVVVRRRSDDMVGTLKFQPRPMLYFCFEPQNLSD